MPFASNAQRRKFYADPKLHRYIAEFEAATPKGAKLPERVTRRSSPGRKFVQVRAHARKHPGHAKKVTMKPRPQRLPAPKVKPKVDARRKALARMASGYRR